MSTYSPIASITLASAASSVTFSGIPQTYTDLVLVADGNVSSGDIRIRYNGDSGSNYSYTRVYGSGSSASSDRGSSQTDSFITIGGFTNANSIVHLQNYSNTTTFKTALVRTNNPGSYVGSYVLLWRSTSAITGIELFVTGGGTISSGTTFNLYGIANASITNVAKATGGDSVYTDGTYWYHIFRSSGTFTPTEELTADYLVVAGGGGATSDFYGGGGGAGGLRCTVTATGGGGSLESALSLTAQAYTVTVGAGGAMTTAGSNSVFSTITSNGGGSTGVSQNGGSGGSGAGGRRTGVGGTGTANQGYAGGDGYEGGSYVSGGGGGAGAAGQNGGATSGGNGGNGVATSISGTSVTYAGGGGGGGLDTGTYTTGTGGSGGGGNAGAPAGDNPGQNGTANTGGGGGSPTTIGATATTGGAGGSGIVIVRYSAA